MYKLLSVEQIRELERRADEEQGLDGASLMREAGLALCEAVIDTLEGPSQLRGDSTAPLAQKVAIFAGPGNNGGDGWSCATFLQQRGVRVTVFSVVDINDLSGIASDAAFVAVNAGVHWTFIDEAALKYETIAVSAGQRGFQVLLSPQTLADYVGAKLLDLQQNG